MNNIVKPITVTREEFMRKMVELINNSHLPLFIIESALKEFTAEVHQGAQQQLKMDEENYNRQLKEQNLQEETLNIE